MSSRTDSRRVFATDPATALAVGSPTLILLLADLGLAVTRLAQRRPADRV